MVVDGVGVAHPVEELGGGVVGVEVQQRVLSLIIPNNMNGGAIIITLEEVSELASSEDSLRIVEESLSITSINKVCISSK